MNYEDISALLLSKTVSDYSRSNYDRYINDTNFSFDIPSIHITGTNGKGSVASYLRDIYTAKGLKVGLFNSPSLIKINELIYINNQMISDDEFVSLFNEMLPLFTKYQLTAFEMETVLAYEYFKRQHIDLAIIEVGMGGYIDATNIITPVLSIITSVSLEHTAYLGRSVSEIAASKAGIIKPGVPCLVGELDETAMYSIRLTAKEMDSKVYQVSSVHNEAIVDGHIIFDYHPYSSIPLITRARYECKNAAIAIEATKLLMDILPVDFETVKQGLWQKNLPCRYEYINEHILIDGGHNPEAMENLVQSIQLDTNKTIHVVFATMKDKNLEQMLIQLGLISDDVTLTTWNHIRARGEMEYFLYLGDYQFVENYQELIKSKLEQYPDDLILVTGSLAFAGVVRDYLLN